ncbi:transcriptional regulator [Bacillus cereus]|uniref:Transcriptional regulator n=1 Tax=Bacillus cereus TaxID=1396 RepID=A0A9X7CSK5_BACCE|nr:helix-turn-helix transcriptional regulator [Bacillus cereus]PGS83986.1 transcriptional regulator [Bacillus cereus]
MSIFDRVKKLADKQNISLSELAKRLDMGENSLYKWKSQNPTVEKLQKVADYFNVSTDYLLGRETTPHDDFCDEDFFAIERAAKKLDPVDRQKLRKIMELTFEKAFSEDDDIDEDDYL